MTVVYREAIEHIQAGAPGRAASVSGPDRQLEGNIQYLKDIYDEAGLGEAVFLRNQAVDPAVKVGQPVYWNYTTNRFEKAMAATTTVAGVVTIADSADVVGIVYSKAGSAIATLLTYGVATVSLVEAVAGAPVAGRYYLSAGTAGRLVTQSPPASILVLRNLGDGRVMVTPTNRIMAQDHQHISLALTAAPAGVCNSPAPGDVHVITVPDATLPGWLPADHSSFGGHAPAHAWFGYNLAVDSVLSALWPPIPIEAVLLELLRSDSVNGQSQIYGRVSPEVVRFNIHGIWWLSNCYNEAPWSVDYNAASSSSSSVSGCPDTIDMALQLSFVRMTFHTG